jgi:hypothetical protein
MDAQESDCIDTLLDVLFYENAAGHLSPEMTDILKRHLRCCRYCRRRIRLLRRQLQDLPRKQGLTTANFERRRRTSSSDCCQ